MAVSARRRFRKRRWVTRAQKRYNRRRLARWLMPVNRRKLAEALVAPLLRPAFSANVINDLVNVEAVGGN